jgi:microcystin-dependent protein
LPDLRGRVPLHVGAGYTLGERGGVESVTLTVAQMPTHGHQYFASQNDATSPLGGSNLVGAAAKAQVFRVTTASADFSPQAIGAAGGSQPHDNLQPYQCINYIIALEGVFPPQN